MLLLISFVAELLLGSAMLLRPHEVRRWLMPDYRRYEGKFAATSLLTYRFSGVILLTMATITGYALLQLGL